MTPEPAVRRKTILIIDDDEAVRDALVMVLSDEGYPVATAVNGLEGLRYLKAAKETPDLILLDVMMPVMDGYQFRAEQRKDPALAAIPVLVLTAGAADPQLAGMAANGYMRKPINLTTLLTVVEAH
jgi:CheY-like chemotaxis protein